MNKLKTILTVGLIAGTLDITAAIIIYSMVLKLAAPQQILQSVASGVYGKATYDGGWNTALAGLGLHFLIAFVFASIFVMLYPLFRKLLNNAVIPGILYGIFVWVVMNYIVIPHSAAGKWPKLDWEFTKTPLSILIIIVCIGLPMSIITGRMFRPDKADVK